MDKRLYRSRDDRMIAGVCGGLAEYFNVDPTIVRLVWVLLSMPGAIGLPLYVIAWILIPPEPVHWAEWRPADGEATGEAGVPPEAPSGTEGGPRRSFVDEECCSNHERRGHWAGIILVLLGGFFLISNLIPWLDPGRLWPVILIVIGIALLVRGRRSE